MKLLLVGVAFLAALGLVAIGGVGDVVAPPSAGSHVRLTPDQEAFCAALVELSGLDSNVCRAWAAAESDGTNEVGLNNFLNIDAFHGGIDYLSPADAAQAAYDLMVANPDWYGPILDSAGGPIIDQLQAIVDSPWDGGHYGGNGRNLIDAYWTILGALPEVCQEGVCAA